MKYSCKYIEWILNFKTTESTRKIHTYVLHSIGYCEQSEHYIESETMTHIRELSLKLKHCFNNPQISLDWSCRKNMSQKLDYLLPYFLSKIIVCAGCFEAEGGQWIKKWKFCSENLVYQKRHK